MAPPSPDSGSTARRFGRYLLLEAIDRGGMADVYRAVMHGPGGFQRQFVIKRIRKEKAASKDFVEMFVNEARISALLDHPNVVQVYDFGQVEGDYFLAMEYLRGKNLLAVMRKLRAVGEHLPPGGAAYVAQQVARGLHYAHSLQQAGRPLGLVHRDVTPSNIMLLRAGGVKLLDFGIARAEMKLRSITPTGGLIKGKFAYMSPEQVKGQPLDGRSDVFSLGVVLWESLTGRRLFHDPNDLQMMRNVLEMRIPPPSMLRHEIPPSLDAIVLRALERDRESRFATAGDMANILEDFVRDQRYSNDALVHLLDRLFGEEESAREALLLPEDTSVAAAKADAAPSSPDAILHDESSYATVSSVHLQAQPAAARARRALMFGAAGFGAVASAAVLAKQLFRREVVPVPAAPMQAAVTQPAPSFEAPPASAPPPAVVAQTEAAAAPSKAASRPAQPVNRRSKAQQALARGKAALRQGELMRARQELEAALEAQSATPEALAGLSEVEFELANYDRALSLARQAAQLAPRSARYKVLMGDALFKLGKHDDAAATYRAAQALHPNDGAIRDRLRRAQRK